MDHELFKLMEKERREEREEYLKRLDNIYLENFKCKKIRAICITIVIVVYIISYFFTPYLAKNYIEGDTNFKVEGGCNNVGFN